eukprot:TRINITY_DN17924_c0_g1_i1.p1 TRINITY_DN17924_c0_g1~~TRINITY_DN17924_c0_g1_i1.p1  ORF type:complete len:395 (-),score=101.48 TRINITY_DN17924_c0_g1_i1:55-1239(-)
MLSVQSGVSMPVRMSSGPAAGLVKKTPLNMLHYEMNAKMIEFFGWEMPVQYPQGVKSEVALCRNGAAVFDVSHMGQLKVYGKSRNEWAERVVVGDIKGLKPNHIKYSVIPNERGGTIDDTMFCNAGDHIYVVVNSACYEKDMKHFAKTLVDFPDVRIENLYDTHALIAIQGPASEETVKKLLPTDKAAYLSRMPFMTRMISEVAGIADCIVSRSGYTGEDGFEISVPREKAIHLGRALCYGGPNVGPAGLGSRDTLRLEASLSLYGQDLDDQSTLVESGLQWCMSKRRRREGGFIGADVICRQLRESVKKQRVGLIVSGAPAREHATVHDQTGKQIGMVTSGGPAPTIGKNVAMATVPSVYAALGTPLQVKIRGRFSPAVVSKMPFLPNRFKRV